MDVAEEENENGEEDEDEEEEEQKHQQDEEPLWFDQNNAQANVLYGKVSPKATAFVSALNKCSLGAISEESSQSLQSELFVISNSERPSLVSQKNRSSRFKSYNNSSLNSLEINILS